MKEGKHVYVPAEQKYQGAAQAEEFVDGIGDLPGDTSQLDVCFRHVSHVDSHLVNALIQLRLKLKDRGIGVTLSETSEDVRRAFEVTSTSQYFDIQDVQQGARSEVAQIAT